MESGAALRILATNDLGAAFVPMPTSYGESGTCAGVVELLEREWARQPTIWLDSGDLVVGSPAHPLRGARPWADVARLPIAAAAAGNHEFDDGVPALREVASSLPFPVLCANVDVGLPGSALLETGVGPLGLIGLTHPQSHRHSRAPEPVDDWPERVAGATAALCAGPVTELDLVRLFDVPDDRPVVVEVGEGELRAAVHAHAATANPGARDADDEWWKLCALFVCKTSTTPGVPAGWWTNRTYAVHNVNQSPESRVVVDEVHTQ